MQMDFSKLKIKFRDSMNYVPSSLKNFARAFGLQETKGDFPHKLNKSENWNKIIPWPDRHDYGYQSMKKCERKRFIKWFRKERRRHHNQFDFNAHFIKYCSQDVLVLQQACEKFRMLFQQVSGGLCPFASGLTTPGMCNYFWRARMLKKNQIALIGPPGQGKKSSVKAERWLRSIELDNDTKLEREFRIGHWTVDGFHSGTKTVYEFLGCMWHGCSDCTTNSTMHPFIGKPMEEVKKATLLRLDAIKTLGYTLVSIWEHDYDMKFASDSEFRKLTELANVEEPLHPRDAFTGGRTNAIKLYHKCGPGEKIYSLDVISEYPYINKNLPYPVGPPVIITNDFPPVEQIIWSGKMSHYSTTVFIPTSTALPNG
ncbi:uncharacterized protein LOC129594605 isoform X3 [Paramacrobiotus metropolitanus]|nr:uncharacterized protein LOC129594605 isoform X3 [Paramacrobiotus metropolitanus]